MLEAGKEKSRKAYRYDSHGIRRRDFVGVSGPGGGSISAYMGALGAALGTMVANLSAHKAGWDDRWGGVFRRRREGRHIQDRLIALVDEDTGSIQPYHGCVLNAQKVLPEEKAARSAALQEATLYATEVPLRTMKTSFEAF